MFFYYDAEKYLLSIDALIGLIALRLSNKNKS